MPGETVENLCPGLTPHGDRPERWLLELSQPDSKAWDRAVAQARKLRADSERQNLILEALRLWALALVPESARRLRETLRPVHSYWLQHCENRPMGFARLVIETARQRSLKDPKDPSRHLQEADELLNTVGLSSIDPPCHQRLEGLALAYQADDLRCLGQHTEAAELLKQADQALGDDAAPDDWVIFLQIEAFRLRDQGNIRQALERLDRAEDLLAHSVIPSSRSDLLLCRGRLQLHARLMAPASATLSLALAHLPAEPPQVLKLEILHSLAASKISLKRYQEAQDHLDQAAELYEFSHEELFAQRQWMLGRIALRQMRLADARGSLRNAIAIFLRLQHHRDAATAFSDLVESYVLDGRLPNLLEDLTPEHIAILSSREFRQLATGKLRQSKTSLRRRGHNVEALEHWIKLLEPAARTWIH